MWSGKEAGRAAEVSDLITGDVGARDPLCPFHERIN